jgi:hypothetical protein
MDKRIVKEKMVESSNLFGMSSLGTVDGWAFGHSVLRPYEEKIKPMREHDGTTD